MKLLSSIKILLGAVAVIACCQAARAFDLYSKPWMPPTTGEWLITEPSQLTSNAKFKEFKENLTAGQMVSNTDPNKCFSADGGLLDGHENDGAFYFQVTLNDPIKLASDEDLVIYTRRSPWSDKHPTIFHVQASADPTSWSDVADVYLFYRGPNTNEFSSRIHTKELEEKGYKYLRFSVTVNNSKSMVSGTEIPYMNVGDFNVLKIKRNVNCTTDKSWMPRTTGKWLVTESWQLTSNGTGSWAGKHISAGEMVTNTEPDKFFSTDGGFIKDHENDEYFYLQVELKDPIYLPKDEDLVIYTRRWHRTDLKDGKTPEVALDKHPITFHVQASVDGSTWSETVVYAFLLYRGPFTNEFSSRIHTKGLEERGYKYLRFSVTANNTKSVLPGTETRYMNVGDFNVMQIKRDANYTDKFVDRLRTVNDYSLVYKNYEFDHTMGIIDPVNHPADKKASVDDKGNRIPSTGGDIVNYAAWSGWSADGKWTKDADALAAAGVTIPDYTLLTPATDVDIAEGVRQPTHVKEHILYAIPGDVLALYPFYDTGTNAYEEVFSHWYDYTTGGHVTDIHGNRLLDFLIDPGGIFLSKKYGYYGGHELREDYDKDYIDGMMPIRTVDDFKEFVKEVKGGKRDLAGTLMADLDFAGEENPFEPMGTWTAPYTGRFEGNGHVMRNIKLNYPDKDDIGVFGYIGHNVKISNLILDNLEVTGKNFIGGLACGIVDNCTASPEIRNVLVKGTVTSKGTQVVGGLFGRQHTNTYPAIIANCAFVGEVSGSSAVWSLGGMDLTNTTVTPDRFYNCYTYATTTPEDAPMFVSQTAGREAVNCYDRTGLNGAIKIEDALTSQAFADKLGSNWVMSEDYGCPIPVFSQPDDGVKTYHTERSHDQQRWYGRVATFFQPRDITIPEGKQHSLEKDEYVIAADFVQEFNRSHNIDQVGKRIIEPSIAYRHIFRVRDGKKFADENMSTVEGNRAYVLKNRRNISALARRQFQIRFDSPLPKDNTTRSRWYYKISDTDYRRVCTQEIRVFKKIDSEWVPWDKDMFEPQEGFNGEGKRTIDGIEYNLCGGGGYYYRFLQCKAEKAVEGEYLVRLVGKDINGNIIQLADNKGELYTEEFHITFLPDKMASVLTEAQLANRPEHSAEYLERPDVCGEPTATINFDEYRLLENTVKDVNDYFVSDGNNHRNYKWPRPWSELDYCFGYNEPHDYNTYRIANHMDQVRFASGISGIQRYDRLYADTGGKERGYFFYCNAAADPGIMAKLEIKRVCLGSTITVSAWAIEGSGGEVCNVAFNVIAVVPRTKDGKPEVDKFGNEVYDRVPVHTFTSGYLPTVGDWYHIYYKFIPNVSDLRNLGIDANSIHHYEIEIENNCKNSGGADYAIDDIRAYVIRPQIYATQTTMFCGTTEADNRSTDVRIETPFEVLLQNFGQAASSSAPGELIDIYYTFLDKEVYDSTLKQTNNAETARQAATLVYGYNWNDKNDTHTYGRLQFSTHFESNPQDAPEFPMQAFRMIEEGTGTRLIVFDTHPKNKDIRVGKEFYVVLFLNDHATEVEPDFDLEDDCAKKSTFRVKGAHITKINGKAHYDNAPFEVCEGQQPVAQVEINAKYPDGTIKTVDIEPFLDWYAGDYEEFLNQKHGGVSLNDILKKFHEVYPDAGSADVEYIEGSGMSQDWLDYLMELCTPVVHKDADGKVVSVEPAKLTLHKTSYVFPPVVIPDDSDDATLYVIAIPPEVTDKEYLICTDPSEIVLNVHRKAPVLLNGFKELGNEYPPELQDVPLRIGLGQIKGVTAADNTLESMEAQVQMLELPIRSVVPVTDRVTGMTLMQDARDRRIYLVETNDPAYISLKGDSESDNLPVAGMVREITAKKDGSGDGNGNFAKIVFSQGFTFREGYYYRLRFNYREDYSGLEISEAAMNVCSGQLVFTLKVVPEYLMWTGEAHKQDVNRNWNNDGNWRRVASDELLFAAGDKTAKADFVTDGGTNDTPDSYAPLNFTKVIIPHIAPESGKDYPMMFDSAGETKDLAGSVSRQYKWSAVAGNDEIGEATKNIVYDMAAESEPAKSAEVWCRPWYANTCDEIHFNVGSQIHRQNYFATDNYKRAWVDIDLIPGRWYTLGMPLQGIVAGDMYLPSSSGIQQTPLFKDINFTLGEYNRFNPAVYQRSWNKAVARVFELPTSSHTSPSNVAVAAAWSNVYNDVTVSYSGGEGFSIKADRGTSGADAGKVRFRLPKADRDYLYYDQTGTMPPGDKTTITRQGDPHRLFAMDKDIEVTVKSAAVGDYFLVGNPFMTRLDMAEFLKANSDVIAPAYWILSGDAQTAAIWSDIEGAFFDNTDGDASTVGVAQGFFVKALKPADELTVKFTAAMMSETMNPSTMMARSSYGSGALTVTALSGGYKVSAASVRVREDASVGFDAAEDAALLCDPSLGVVSTVYTVAGNQAAVINSRPSLAGTEIGLIAGDDVETTIVFTGTDVVGDLQLLDTATGTLTEIYEGMEYDVRGNASGRLFIVESDGGVDMDGISVTVSDHKVTVASAVSEVGTRVYDTLGRLVGAYSNGSQVVSFCLNDGIYIVEATDKLSTVTRKICVK